MATTVRWNLPLLAGTALLAGIASCGEIEGPTEASPAAEPTTDSPQVIAQLPGGGAIEFVWIEAGSFSMGSPAAEPDRKADEGPQRAVTISRGFYLGKSEVTQLQWEALMGANPSSYQGAGRPVESVSWDEVQDFIQGLNSWAGAQIYRLPTEAEWEYACRGGTSSRWSFGDSEGEMPAYAWYNGNNSLFDTKEVGTKLVNPRGLFDMHGNVWEWTRDWYDADYYGRAPNVDPPGPAFGDQRVIRGGDFASLAFDLRSAGRGRQAPDRGFSFVGFRLLRTE